MDSTNMDNIFECYTIIQKEVSNTELTRDLLVALRMMLIPNLEHFLKSIVDSINYEHRDRPFFKTKKFDGLVEFVHFYQNMAILKKGESKKIFYKDQKTKKNLIENLKKIIAYLYG